MEDPSNQLSQTMKLDSNAKNESDLTTNEFTYYLSPRYFRLIFPQYKPATKNGDLVSALNELRAVQILTDDSHWDRIKLTKKGSQYKKLIQRLIEINALYYQDGNGILDYRSDQGRKAILELIRFLSAKLDFSEYFRYLNLPLFESEQTQDWMSIFGNKSDDSADEDKIDISSEETKNHLMDFIYKKKNKFQGKSNAIDKKIVNQTKPIKLSIALVSKILKKVGLNRPEPLYSHFDTNPEPRLFFIYDRNFYVNLSELNKIKTILAENLSDFGNDDNKWLNDYFEMLKLPSTFGFQKSEISFTSKDKEINTFLNLAIEGPKIFATQFSSLSGMGELILIIFSINESESLVIYNSPSDILYYFTISTNHCSYSITTDFISFPDFPAIYRTSRKRFGKLLDRSYTPFESNFNVKFESVEDREDKKTLDDEFRLKKEAVKEQLNSLSYFSASLFTICQAIVQKFSSKLDLNQVLCIYHNGIITFTYIDSDTILTYINKGSVDLGSELKTLIKRIEDGMQDILGND